MSSELAEQYRPQDPNFTGVFLILVAKAPALVWEVSTSARGVAHLTRKTPWPYVNHYHFHIVDKDWGHLTFKLSGHPPFGLPVMLNGHEMGRAPRPPARRPSRRSRRATALSAGRTSGRWSGWRRAWATRTPSGD